MLINHLVTNRNKALGTIILIIGGYTSIFLFQTHQVGFITCPIRNLTGIPCPGCGMTRATIELLNGNIAQSLKHNLLCIPFSLTIILSVTVLAIDTFKKTNKFYTFLNRDLSKTKKVLLIIGIGISWAFNIFRLKL